MRLTTTTVRVVARTPPLPVEVMALSRLTADAIAGELRLHACLYYAAEDGAWRVHRYVYRLLGGLVHERNAVSLKLVSNGNVVHAFDSPRDVVNDGRWYVHEHEAIVAREALTYARFEAIFDVPGIVALLRREAREAAPQPLRARSTAPRQPPPGCTAARTPSRSGSARSR